MRLHAGSFYDVRRGRVAELLRAAIALPVIQTVDPDLLLRALAIYEIHGLDFADAYIEALAEVTAVGEVVSFDRSIDRVPTASRREP